MGRLQFARLSTPASVCDELGASPWPQCFAENYQVINGVDGFQTPHYGVAAQHEPRYHASAGGLAARGPVPMHSRPLSPFGPQAQNSGHREDDNASYRSASSNTRR